MGASHSGAFPLRPFPTPEHSRLGRSCRDEAHTIRCGCRLGAIDGCGRPRSAVASFPSAATADGVPRLLGTHTRGTVVARCTVGLSSARRAGLMHVPCVRSARQLGTAHSYTAASAFGIMLIGHICPAKEAIPALQPAHICHATESIPRPHLCHHCCPPGHLPLRNTSVTQQHTVLQPYALCCNLMPPLNDPAADGTCCNRLHAAALPCHWLHPIQSKHAKRGRRWPNRVACARCAQRHCGRGLAPT